MQIRKRELAVVVAAVVVAAAAFAVGCGNGGDSASGNATDAAFITDMTAHHQGAIEMARLARQRAEHPEVRKLADDIISVERAEISVMVRIGDDVHAMGGHGGEHMGVRAHNTGTQTDMPALRRAHPFDRAFIDAMVPHHQGAIAMARVELAKGAQPALRQMAKNIIAVQTKEIAQMRSWRKRWYGSTSGAR